MSDNRYIISDASKQVDVEPHVLRYWEDELDIQIPRNEMGHRYYREEDIELLKTVKTLKEQGFQLKAIRLLLPDIHRVDALDSKNISILRDELNQRACQYDEVAAAVAREEYSAGVSGACANLYTRRASSTQLDVDHSNQEKLSVDKMQAFQTIMSSLIQSVVRSNNQVLVEEVTQNVSQEVSDRVNKQMDYLFRLQEERDEIHYSKLDQLIRTKQQDNEEQATGKKNKSKKKWKREQQLLSSTNKR